MLHHRDDAGLEQPLGEGDSVGGGDRRVDAERARPVRVRGVGAGAVRQVERPAPGPWSRRPPASAGRPARPAPGSGPGSGWQPWSAATAGFAGQVGHPLDLPALLVDHDQRGYVAAGRAAARPGPRAGCAGASEPNRMIPPAPSATRVCTDSTASSSTGTTTSWAARRSRLQVPSTAAGVHAAAADGREPRTERELAAGSAVAGRRGCHAVPSSPPRRSQPHGDERRGGDHGQPQPSQHASVPRADVGHLVDLVGQRDRARGGAGHVATRW